VAVVRIVAVLVRRLGAALFTLWAMITLTFALFWAIPSEPEVYVYPYAQHLSEYQIKHADHLLGLDRPKLEQYGDYLWHIVRFDFGGQWTGASVTAGKRIVEAPIRPVLFEALGVTMSIVLGGAMLVLLLAMPLGAIAGRYAGTWLDRTISLVALIAICTHPMVLGLILRTTFANRLHWAPPTGYCNLIANKDSVCSGPEQWASHLVLPWVTFALLFLALYIRMVRSSVIDTLHEDFVRTARAKGVGEARVLRRHVVPHASLRVLTMVGMEVGTAIGVCLYIEAAFGFQGLGRMAVDNFIGGAALDLPQILAVVTTITFIVVVGNVIVDTLYAFVDPRVDASFRGRRTTKEAAGGVI
jgi:peptide/nickel transport system permease protein